MATYYVDGAVGNDANAGTSEGSGNAWATIDKAMNTVAAGDTVFVKASAAYTEQATIDTPGTAASPIRFKGYSSTVEDTGIAVVDATGLGSAMVGYAGAAYYSIENFEMKNANNDGFDGQINLNDTTVFKNCSFNNNGQFGATVDDRCGFERCTSFSNTSGGFDGDQAMILVSCTAYSNGGTAVTMEYGVAYNCLLYNNDDNGIRFTSNNDLKAAFGNTIDGDAKNNFDCIHQDNASGLAKAWVNNICFNASGTASVGIKDDLDTGRVVISCNNLVNNNTSDYSGAATFFGEVTGDPTFVDEANDDYKIATTGSPPQLAAGLDAGEVTNSASFTDIGALQREEQAGGGGGGGVRNPIRGPI